jgi:hypothetical protein
VLMVVAAVINWFLLVVTRFQESGDEDSSKA